MRKTSSIRETPPHLPRDWVLAGQVWREEGSEGEKWSASGCQSETLQVPRS